MNRVTGVLATIFLCTILIAGNGLASNITIADGNSDSTNSWYTDGANEDDQEVEPGNQTGQIWDLEGFFLNGTSLTMVGGYDFINGQGGYASGDIFIDVNGDAIYGVAENSTLRGYKTVTGATFGYDYVIDLDFSPNSLSYKVFKLDSLTSLTVYYGENYESNPWQYVNGGEEIVAAAGTIGYQTDLSDADTGFLGDTTDAPRSHNSATVDIGFLGHGVDFTSHFTIGCGNDNLMGKGTTPTPEPATMLLFGFGLIGLAGVGRRKLIN